MWFSRVCIKLTFRSLQQKICLQPPRIVLEHFQNLFAWTCIRIVSYLPYCHMCMFWSFNRHQCWWFPAFSMSEITSIPPSIKGCSSLAELYMGLVLHSWDIYVFFALHLTFCDIKYKFTFSVLCPRNNLLSSIPANIGTLSKLGILDLHSNQVRFICYMTKLSIWSSLCPLAHLETLNPHRLKKKLWPRGETPLGLCSKKVLLRIRVRTWVSTTPGLQCSLQSC